MQVVVLSGSDAAAGSWTSRRQSNTSIGWLPWPQVKDCSVLPAFYDRTNVLVKIKNCTVLAKICTLCLSLWRLPRF